MKTARLIVVGFGNIGRGFLEVLKAKQKDIRRDYGLDIRIIAVCEVGGSLINDKGIDIASALSYAAKGALASHPDWSSKKSLEVIGKLKADIVLELTPGNIRTGEPGLGHIMKALRSGKNVVTSNKAPLALSFWEIMDLAKKRGLRVGYEATVGGAIPIINLYKNDLGINKVKSIYGILNGTSNFILTKMLEEELTLETALKEAQELGIAERDPSYDIKGIDSAVKLVILANSILGERITLKDISVTGIEDVTPEALEMARKNGCVVKLIGDVTEKEVSPRLVPVSHPLNVSGTLNAVMLEMDVAGSLTLVGCGAGRTETASSIFSDVLSILTNGRL